MIPSLSTGFLQTTARMPERPALWVGGAFVSYADLRHDALRIAATLQRFVPPYAPPLTAVFAERSRCGFGGILGALLAGHGYVPLNVSYPIARTRRMLEHAGCTAIVVDAEAEAHLTQLVADSTRALVIVLPERADVTALRRQWPQHVIVGAGDLAPAREWSERRSRPSDPAYLLYTSGSTGTPKGVAISHANVTHFLETMIERYQVGPDDRFSHMFDSTFDLSVFDLFVAWHVGACVFCPTRATLLNPDRFIRDHQLTVWFSVPTIALLMKRFGSLRAGRYPSLRWSLFCGEPLPIDLAQSWIAAAPRSELENLYGPTELTIACTAYRWNPSRSASLDGDGLVPIGLPLRGMHARIVDEQLAEVGPGTVGELLVAGPQRANGYWRDTDATARAFVSLPGEADLFYRTGDRVRREADDQPIAYVGRVDHQIKVLGHRVELEEVETVLRQEPGVHQAVAVGWPATGTGNAGIVAFVAGSDIDPVALRARVRQKLQSYAVPQSIRVLAALPQNANGKVDRQALLGILNG